jgi:microcompartment protein CcmL/EutN
MLRKILMLIMVAGFLMITSVWAGEIEKAEEKGEEIKASVIIPMKLEGLEWKLKYYQEKTVSMQLRAMVQIWNQPEFQETQKIIRQTDQEIKRLLILK